MDSSILGLIGFAELIVILIIMLLVMGPQQVRQLIRKLGYYVGQLQAVSRSFVRQLNAELDAVDSAEVRETMDDVKRLRQELDELRSSLAGSRQDLLSESRKAAQEGEDVIKGKKKPPET